MKRCDCCGDNMTVRGNQYYCASCGNTAPLEKSAPAPAPTPTPVNVSKKSTSGADVFENNVNGILEIRCPDGNVLHSGSGLLINKIGYCVTNAHVVSDKTGRVYPEIQAKLAGETVKAYVMVLADNQGGHGKGDDLAVLRLERVPSKACPVKLADFNKVRIGEEVFVIGNSLGYGTCITSGIVSDKSRNVNGKMLMMTDCAVNGGNSGGPIFNAEGNVIGVICSGIDGAEGMNFAIPTTTVKKCLDVMASSQYFTDLKGTY